MTLPLISKSMAKVKKPPIKTFQKMSSQIKKVLDFMKDGKEYQSADIGEMLGVKDSRTKEILRCMIANDQIETTGGNRNGRYLLKKTNS